MVEVEYIFHFCHMLAKDAIEEDRIDLCEEALNQFKNRMNRLSKEIINKKKVMIYDI